MREAVSVVVPIFDEAACLPELHRRLGGALGEHAEILYVDDRSTDGSWDLLARIAAEDPRVRAVRLARNAGSQAAIACGLELARGDAVISLDADLQHPPERIADMLDRWREGADVVHMVRRGREHQSWIRGAASHAFYFVFNAASRVRIVPDSADFRLLDRKCVDALLRRRGRLRFLRAAVREIGFHQTTLEYDPAPRFAGRSRYTLGGLAAVALDALLAYSSLPVVVPAAAGAAVGVLSLVLALAVLSGALPAVSSALLVSAILVASASFLISTALVLAYARRLAREVTGEPLYVVDEIVGRGLATPALRPVPADASAA